MKVYLNFTTLICLIVGSCLAQNENKKWYFGQNAGIDFTSGSPVALTGGALTTDDNTATISDANGNLLFYTNGVTVWNRLHNVMANGSGLLGHISGGQPATIVPHPGNPNLFYLFTVDAWAFSNGLRYSIIDMSQQSGLGAVTAVKNIVIYTPATEKVIAVKHCNRQDFWLITHAWQSNQFKVYRIDNNGFNPIPLSSTVGTIHTGGTSGFYNAAGQITVSPDGSRIALAVYDMGIVELLDFNNTNGQVTNPITVSGFTNAWGVEFSPNGNVLYITRWQGSALWQINLLAGNAAAIQASSFLVGTPSSPHNSYKSGYLKRACDGKIYVAKYTSTFIGVINSPNTLGSGCNFVDNGFSLGGPVGTVGFDNSVYQAPWQPPVITVAGTCTNQFGISDTTDIMNVLWNFGDPSSGTSDSSSLYSPIHSFTSGGTYTVQVVLNYACYSDTITQTVNTLLAAPLAQYSVMTSNCDSTITIINSTTNSSSYSWNFGDGDTSTLVNPTHIYPGAGTYTVTLIATNSCGADTVLQTVIIQSGPTCSITGTDTICTGQQVTLTATGGTSIQWSGGSTATTYTITDSPSFTTTYFATVSNGTCLGIPDTFTVVVRPLPLVSIVGQTGICAGQNITLSANGSGTFQWSGGSTATTSSINIAPLSTTTYFVNSFDGMCTSLPDTFVVTVLPTPIVSIVGPTTICLGQTVTLAATGANAYQWSGAANDTTPTITVSPTTTTTYYASPSTVSSCPGISDTLTITVLPTPIINVGGNSTICAGESTTLTASGGSSYLWSGGASDTTAAIVVSPVVTTTYFVTTSNGPCASPFDTITVTVLPSPSVSIIGGGPICAGSSVTLVAVGTATTWVWSGGASGTGTTITDNPTGPTVYYLVGYNTQGCSDTDMVSVGLFDTPSFAVLGDDTICQGESTSLICTGNGSFVWTPSTGLSSTTSQNVIASPTTTISYSVQITDLNGCTGSDVFSLVIDPCVGISEEGLPNGNKVEIFPNPSAGSISVDVQSDEPVNLEVFDAIGKVVFFQSNANKDGSVISLDLSNLAEGSYFIKITNPELCEIRKLILAR